MDQEFLPPASEKVREGVFLKRALPSGRWLTVYLRWEGQKKTWTCDPPQEQWTGLDREWVYWYIEPQIKMKLDECYDLVEPNWMKKRLAAWKAEHPESREEQPEVQEEEPKFIILIPLTEEMCRMILPRAV